MNSQTVFPIIVCAMVGYILGSFPTGYLVGRMWKTDVRTLGSGRTGGTNVLRSLGWQAFGLTIAGDVLKGIAAVVVAKSLFPNGDMAHVAAVLSVLVGNNWSIWIALLAGSGSLDASNMTPSNLILRVLRRSRGGAGVVATAGAGLALFPPCGLVLIPAVVLVLLVTRYASVASLTAATLYPIVMFCFAAVGSAPWSYFALSACAAALVFVVHIPNIRRLRAGTERRFGQRLRQFPPSPKGPNEE